MLFCMYAQFSCSIDTLCEKMNRNFKIPQIQPELIEYLNNIYPLSSLTEVRTLEDLKYTQGQISVVTHLTSLFENQKNHGNILDVQS